MSKRSKILLAVGSFLAITILTAGLALVISPVRNSFAQAPTPTAPAASAPAKGDLAAYKDAFQNALASRLGVTLEKLKEAYLGAFNDTVDKATTDGALTQDQANQLKNNAANRLNQEGLPGFLGGFGGHKGFGRGGFGGMRGGLELASFAKALNMQESDLITELQSGKTISDVATEKNVDLAQVKTSVLSDFKTQMDQAVQAGKLTQTQADAIYNRFSTNLDTIVTQPMNMHGKGMHGGDWDGGAPFEAPNNAPNTTPNTTPGTNPGGTTNGSWNGGSQTGIYGFIQ